MSKDGHEYCDDGYILKSKTLNNGEVIETVLMDDMGSYGWNHTSLKKIDKDTYHVYIGCGSPCGTNILFGRGGKEQYFGRYFTFDLNSRCSVGYNNDKQLWTASRFFQIKKSIFLQPMTLTLLQLTPSTTSSLIKKEVSLSKNTSQKKWFKPCLIPALIIKKIS
ncbi:hypothetical protein [Psychrobacter sp. JCM 18903]|uniref:hypothetical protein n=1 Tax=Psychrobacter sp. JCM 18903 TaxID=1298610 RepID=UPI001A9F6A75|nr:hypothetical protein [Psychrobacter sp. JCM 18903]